MTILYHPHPIGDGKICINDHRNVDSEGNHLVYPRQPPKAILISIYYSPHSFSYFSLFTHGASLFYVL